MQPIRLICFDLDDTLITHNSWQKLNAGLGVTSEKDIELYDQYKGGQITYDEWNQKLLEIYLEHPDATRDGITAILSRYEYTPDAKEVVEDLKKKGYHLVLISGSIVTTDLGIDYFKANNTLVFDEAGALTGVHSGGADNHAKVRYLEAFAEMLNVPLDQCACIGDGANDLEMFQKTGRGITFTGSKIEQDAWQVIESLKDLETLFPAL